MDKLSSLDMKVVFLLGLLLAIFYYGTAFDDGSRFDERLKKIKVQMVDARKKVEKVRALMRDQEIIQSDLEQLGVRLQQVSGRLPADLNIPALVETITKVSKTAGVKILGIKPSEPKKQGIYEEIQIEVSLNGRYSNMASFISEIIQLERIVKVSSLKIAKAVQRGRSSSIPQDQLELTMEANLSSYRYLEQKNPEPNPGVNQ